MSDYPRPNLTPAGRPRFTADRWVAASYAVYYVVETVRGFEHLHKGNANNNNNKFTIVVLIVAVVFWALWLVVLWALYGSRRWSFFGAIVFSCLTLLSAFRQHDLLTSVTYAALLFYSLARLNGTLGERAR